MKTEILFGIHPVLEALRSGRREFIEIYINKDIDLLSKRLKEVINLAESLNILIKKIPAKTLKSLTKSQFHQGIGAKVSTYPLANLSEMFDMPEPFLLILDSVVDTHNLGAIIRSALCAGVDGIIIPKDRAAPPSPAVSRASAGALEHILLVQVTNLVNVINILKKKNVWVAGMDKAAKNSVFESNLKGSLAIVIGGEEKGIRPLVKKQCDFLISIPQEGLIDSLNASVAGAVVMYESYRQRHFL